MLFALPICRCFCGSTRKDEFDPDKVLENAFEDEKDSRKQPKPRISGFISYSSTTNQLLRGVPIREGSLWLLSAEEEVASVQIALYVNGFAFTHRGREHSFSLSPFTLVRNCKFQAAGSYDGADLSDYKCFKVSLFTQGQCFYFGVRSSKAGEREAEEERSRWVIDISRAMRLITQSLFPPFQIDCDPTEGAPATRSRIMAGYLLHHDDVTVASVLYCELHPQHNEHGRLVVYENELCRAVVMEICLTERSTCSEKVGINCSVFSVEDQIFSSRTVGERKLWLRAISNVKVKLQNRAPNPDREELMQYRQAIKDHIRVSTSSFQSPAPMDALLHRHPQRSSQALPAEDPAASHWEPRASAMVPRTTGAADLSYVEGGASMANAVPAAMAVAAASHAAVASENAESSAVDGSTLSMATAVAATAAAPPRPGDAASGEGRQGGVAARQQHRRQQSRESDGDASRPGGVGELERRLPQEQVDEEEEEEESRTEKMEEEDAEEVEDMMVKPGAGVTAVL